LVSAQCFSLVFRLLLHVSFTSCMCLRFLRRLVTTGRRCCRLRWTRALTCRPLSLRHPCRL
jgi:hypothetical protein